MRPFANHKEEFPSQNNQACGRQIALAAAFLLPAAKLLEAPSLLAQYAGGDLLLPALLHFIVQGAILFALLYAASKSEKSLFERLQIRFGKWSVIFYGLYASYFLFAAILPLFDMDKFTYAAFFDTSPSVFSFIAFFAFSAFLCTKGLKTLARAADFCLFLYLIPFLALIAMSFFAADFSHLLPLFENQFGDTMYAFTRTTPHFSDAVLLLPLIGNLRYKKGDAAKVLTGYGIGAASTLLFLATFLGIYSSIAPREHYAFSKIAEYFPALDVIGRFDLLFVYALTVVLLIFTAMPLQYTTQFTCQGFGVKSPALVSAILNIGLLLFLLFCNKYYNTIYEIISGKLPFVFWLIADIIPLFFLLLPKNKGAKEVKSA